LHHTHIVPVFDVGQVGGLCYYAMQRIEGSGLDRVIKHLRRDRAVAAGSTLPGRTPSPGPSLNKSTNRIEPSGLLGDSTATWGSRTSNGLPRDLEDEPTPFEPPRGTAYYRWVATVGRQAAEALSHAHQRGVIHRDVKPSNLLVDARGIVWMADFGLARRLADPSQTQVDSLLGTPRYMSPEQAKTGPIDGRSDVYSLGATLYELLTLRPPFEGKTAAELIEQIATRDPLPVHQIDPKVPRDLETVVLKALHKRADDRYASASELADDLERYLNMEPVKARRIGPLGRAWRVARRNKRITIVSAIAAACVILSTTLAYVRILKERNDAIVARGESQRAADKLAIANAEVQSALRLQLIQNSQVVRLSAVANRRSTGLDLLQRAAQLPAELNEDSLLRDEAVAFLSIRDVEKRPDIPLNEQLQAFVFGSDGTRVATLSDDGGTVRFWNVTSQTLLNTHVLKAKTPAPPDGQGPGNRSNRGRGNYRSNDQARIASAGDDIAVLHPDGKEIDLFNAKTGGIRSKLRFFSAKLENLTNAPDSNREIIAIAFAANGNRLVTIDTPKRNEGDGFRFDNMRGSRFEYRVHLWDPRKPEQPLARLFETKPEPKPENYTRFQGPQIPMIAISPDGETVAVAIWNESEIAIWKQDGKEKKEPIDSQAQLTALALGNDDLLAAAGNRAVHLWDLKNLDKTKASLPSLNPNLGFVDQLRFSPDDSTLLAVVGSRGSSVELWDIAATSRVATLPLTGEWHGVAIAPKSRLLAVGQASSLTVWELVDPQVNTPVAGTDRLRNLAFAPNGDLAMQDWTGTIKLWTQGHCAAAARPVVGVKASTMSFDSKGRLIVQFLNRSDQRGRPLLQVPQERIDWIDLADAKSTASVAAPEAPRPQGGRPGPGGGGPPRNQVPFQKIVRTPDDQLVVFTRFNEVSFSRPTVDGRPGPLIRAEFVDADSRPIVLQRTFWRDVAIHPSGSRLYLFSFGNDEIPSELSVWAIRENRLERIPTKIPVGKYRSFALSPDGSRFAIGEVTGRVQLYDAWSCHLLQEIHSSDADAATPVESLAFSPDRSHLAVGTSGLVRIWALHGSHPRPFVKLPSHRGPVMALAYNQEGNRLAVGSGEENGVKVWDLERIEKELARLGMK
jgi:WD40 repeat protein